MFWQCPIPGLYGITPYLEFDNTLQCFLYRPTESGLDIETDLTIWTWIRFHAPSTGVRTDIFDKWMETAMDDRAWLLSKSVGDVLNFNISTDGLNIVTVNAAAGDYTLNLNKWIFLAGRFIPGTELALFIGEAFSGKFTWYRNLVAIPPTIFINLADLCIGMNADFANWLDADLTQPGIAATSLTDIYVQNLFSQSRTLFV